MNRDEFLTSMGNLTELAEKETSSLSTDEIETYTKLESDLENLNATEAIQKRQKNYMTRIPAPTSAITTRQDDSEERAFEHFMRTGQKNSDLTEYRGQDVATNSEGGYLVP